MPSHPHTPILTIYKPAGITSFDVIRRLRRIFPNTKMGHAGTLDPFASGVLLVAFGHTTKEIPRLQTLEKEYVATLKLGTISTTYDPTGVLIHVCPRFQKQQFTKYQQYFPVFFKKINCEPPSRQQIRVVLHQFVGNIDQIPPVFSAKKLRGVRAYILAREGKPVIPPPRKVSIRAISVLSYRWPVLTICVVCGSGTYIRSLAYDIGMRLGCGAYLSALVRTRIGRFRVKDAKRLSVFSTRSVA
ncbi:MAG: hypothetical protein A3B74_02390 [Candidatus Kerfeldbacteria bacterium RIFCSPHIGHO2_02_FULL_42_14]|uniref:tRNA pseudouridine synthase B n=1 Tax=Candidatus Kerfeldbacteria bacterium RIFCSPHIGHO2_02_FULL_42_14 TaxID=1798540 RepID=A0A1G2AU97_9BACT|nr:MAG: hypothetical protein A3B74_02390 [Candidatus Kerfeldbacteria bacterium RIFCSPHIGHO2_02_FULL_42_14]OGY80394.1 MAG: hypothetical protein A3E60_05010 [Candidatus Kerfeldbacteria bacterium RIFCSPHIGHO2_12_FULL_42_13]OGY83823.1 MAG: hypothetical protein A3I91_04535 [Candidatus Kerfeldbacteria bacterium RIFCSPLOWO2_02_FULL_42_19]OGY85403.1 MAG: hypothetical protein A3G01_02330 [Candidatus Kerfeldbacteria bacterium RIFCSPLOWO2_12_FULL_43_9]